MKDEAERPAVRPDDVLVAYGDACAMLTPLIKARMGTLASGDVLEVKTDDPASREAMPAWSRLTGHAIVGVDEEDERKTTYFVRKK
jgi:TusA-related sulfurtransferase